MEVSKNVYYVALSQLQKAIRLGLVEEAVFALQLCYQFNPWFAFRRLFVILGEDCSRDHALIEYALTFSDRGCSYKNFDDVALLAVMMAQSQGKSHEVSYAPFVLNRAGHGEYLGLDSPLTLLPEIVLKELCTDFDGITEGRYVDIFSSFMDVLLLKRLYSVLRKIDSGERQLRLYPLWRHWDGKAAFGTTNESNSCPQVLDRSGWLLLNAVDNHTMIGKYANAIVRKKYPFGEEDFVNAEWCALSGRLNGKVDNSPIEALYCSKLAKEIGWYVTNAEKVMSLRKYALEKRGTDILGAFLK